jgi:ribosome-binding protein aMBF1 (putative translation factor)
MTARQSWDEVKAARAQSPKRRRGYEKAGRAIRLVMEIRALREARGLSQRELAGRVGTTQSAIARVEGCNISPSLGSVPRRWPFCCPGGLSNTSQTSDHAKAMG